MTLKTKLFLFIPSLVILLNIVALVIFDSGQKVQQSYDVLMQRILLYKQVTSMTDQNLRSLNQFILRQDTDSYEAFLAEKKQLQQQVAALDESEASIEAINYRHTIETFLGIETALMTSIQSGNFDRYIEQYDAAEKTADFIREDSQQLVDAELTNYQKIYPNIQRDKQRLNTIGMWLFVVTISLGIVFALWLSRSITVPINRLARQARQIAEGNLTVEPRRSLVKDEIGVLHDTMQTMVAQLQTYVTKQVAFLEKDRLVKELELKALQSQINPHFLFNTLNVISKLAYIEGAERTSDLTVSTSNLIRYNLRKLDQPVTLRDEVDNAKEYFAIQKARFRERIQFRVHVDEAALDMVIPCLTLQPIIENAFVHGIESMEEQAEITLIIERREHELRIAILDNGAGMDEATRQLLLADDEQFQLPMSTKTHTTGLGTRNVFKRLRLYYGAAVKIEIESDLGRGTMVQFLVEV